MKFLIYVMWCFRKCRINYIIHVFIYKIHLHMNLMHMLETQWLNGIPNTIHEFMIGYFFVDKFIFRNL